MRRSTSVTKPSRVSPTIASAVGTQASPIDVASDADDGGSPVGTLHTVVPSVRTASIRS